MDQDRKQSIALMRYSAIAPLISGTQTDYESLSAFFREVSAKGLKAPNGELRHYSPATIEKWYTAYRKDGFDALIPSGRSDCGVSRKIDDELSEEIRYLKIPIPGFQLLPFTGSSRIRGAYQPDRYLKPLYAGLSTSWCYRNGLLPIRICAVMKGPTSTKYGAVIPASDLISKPVTERNTGSMSLL